MSDIDKLVAKIEKLLSLAQSSNEHEAKAAAEKASELLVRHNLTLQQVVGREPAFKIEERDTGSHRFRTEDKFVTALVTKFFFVRIVVGRKRVEVNGEMRAKTVLSFIGEEVNAKVAAYVWEFLVRKYKELWADYRLRFGAEARARQSYYMGLTYGLQEQLRAKRASVEEDMALVAVVDPKLNEFVESIARGTKRASFDHKTDPHAHAHGAVEGRSLHISRGIEQKESTRGPALAHLQCGAS